MRIVPFLLSFLVSAQLYAAQCPNFSGNYLYESFDERYFLEVKAFSCDLLEMRDTSESGFFINTTYNIDGKWKIVQNDGVIERADLHRWNGNILEMIQKDRRLSDNRVISEARRNYFLDQERNLVTTMYTIKLGVVSETQTDTYRRIE